MVLLIFLDFKGKFGVILALPILAGKLGTYKASAAMALLLRKALLLFMFVALI